MDAGISDRIHYGDFVGTCQVHFGEATQFGTLVDRVGHCWLVCQDCINALWAEKQAYAQPYLMTREDAVDSVLADMRERLLGGGD